MLILNWKFVFVVALVGITAAGIGLMVNASRETGRTVVWKEFRVHLGSALLISAITIVLIDLQLQRDMKTQIDDIPRGMLSAACRGDKDVEGAVSKMLLDPVRYSNVEIVAQLSPDPILSPSHSKWTWKTSFDVRNVSDSEITWDFQPVVATDLEGEPVLKIKPSVTEEGHDENLAENGVLYEDLSGLESFAQYKTIIKLRSNTLYHVCVYRVANDRLEKGYMTHFFTKITSKVKFSVTVDPELFDVKIEPYYPGGIYRDLKATLNNPGPNQLDSYETRETLLPYQGFQVYWTYKGSIASKTLSSK